MGRILNFGSLNVDHVYRVAQTPAPGETRAADRYTVFCGGKGLNQSVAAARAGAQVTHIGAVGNADGAMLVDMLRQAGVDTGRILLREGASGHTIIQVTPDGQNSILLWPGANRTLCREELPQLFAGFGSGDFLLLQNETSCVAEAIELGTRQGMTVCLNPSPMEDAAKRLPLERCGMLLLNQGEAEALCQEADPERQLAVLRERLPKTDVVLTLGARGAWLQRAETGEQIWQESFSVQAVDTTGAGDTFTGFFLAALAGGKPGAAAAREAAAAAALAVTRPGAAASIPTGQEVQTFLQGR